MCHVANGLGTECNLKTVHFISPLKKKTGRAVEASMAIGHLKEN
jgi:hypothetical protein